MSEGNEPYKAEYAKSGRSSCKGCKSPIAQGEFRLAVMVQSSHFDGKVPYWFHSSCFFKKHKPKAIGDICKFDGLRVEDQQFVMSKINATYGSPEPEASGSKGKGKKATKRKSTGKISKGEFKVEYSVSNRAVCIGCEQKIVQGDIRCAKMDFESEKAVRFGGIPRWYHLTCFKECRPDTEFWDSGDKLAGFAGLSADDRKEVLNNLPKIDPIKKEENGGPSPTKRPKFDQAGYEKQNKALYKLRDQLMTLPGPTLKAMLEHNKMNVPAGKDRILDALADAMMFGALEVCPECKHGYLYYRNSAYNCGGEGEWAACAFKTDDPPRKAFKVQKKFKEQYDFLGSFKGKVAKRIMLQLERSEQSSDNVQPSVSSTIKVNRPKPPLDRMYFVVNGQLSKPLKELRKDITRLGGTVVSEINDMTMALIADKATVKKGTGKKILEAEAENIHIVPEDFLEAAKGKTNDEVLELVKSMALNEWDAGDPSTRLQKSAETEEQKSKSKSMYSSNSAAGSSKVKLTMKNGAYVDPDSGLAKKAHVFKEGKELYTAVLSKSDVQKGTNSYYKMQVLEADNKQKWWVFRAWGRIGTTIGGTKLEEFDLPDDAVENFENQFREHTGNSWHNHRNFQKQPGKYMLMDLDMGQDKQQQLVSLEKAGLKSNLPTPVQDLVKMMFDIKAMEKAMLEFELDLEKMPLGKLSERQIREAFGELAKLQNAIHDVKNPSKGLITASTNRFYTLIPHCAGTSKLPMLDNEEIIKSKLDMLESLLEMEVAYGMMKTDDSKTESSELHPVDHQYSKLKTTITVLDKDSEEFGHLQAYVRNTHAETHQQYELDIQEVFKVERHGEDKRYKPWKKLPNRKLLWHGSRLTNFAGILSQGLRIAPPEAPVTGYMFGKGIYFADMVSKSANYCFTTKKNNTGLLLLCEVALGHIEERTQADYIENLPKGKHSVKGVGQTHPDPEHTVVLPHGVEVPLGPPTKTNVQQTSLLYNEYIVYDASQVKIEYLLKLNFKYKY